MLKLIFLNSIKRPVVLRIHRHFSRIHHMFAPISIQFFIILRGVRLKAITGVATIKLVCGPRPHARVKKFRGVRSRLPQQHTNLQKEITHRERERGGEATNVSSFLLRRCS